MAPSNPRTIRGIRVASPSPETSLPSSSYFETASSSSLLSGEHGSSDPHHPIPLHNHSYAVEKDLDIESVPLTSDHDHEHEHEDNPVFLSELHHPRRSPYFWRRVASLPTKTVSFFSRSRSKRQQTFDGADSSSIYCTPRSKLFRTILLFIIGALAMLGLIQVISMSLAAFLAFFPDDIDFVLDHWGDVGSSTEGFGHWPTDFTADVQPIQCHSHNDYWRKVPLYEAIHYGCVGVEADVWLFDEELYVGHSRSSLTPKRTLQNLYINPILEILEKQNPITSFNPERTRFNGVFDTDPDQPLILLIDFKTSGPALFPYVEAQLAPLRDRGYLTHWNGTGLVQRPVTIVGSGNTPYDLVAANSTYRDIFFDAPLDSLGETSTTWQNPGDIDSGSPPPPPNNQDNGQGHSVADPTAELPPYSSQNSYYASVSFKQSIGLVWGFRLNNAQIQLIRSQISNAHKAGLKVRYWGVPSWPKGLRNHIWHILIREGADMLNVDDLKGATRRDWRRHKGWWY